MKKKYSWKAGVLGLLLLTGTACTDEMETGVSGILRQGEVALQWLGPNMGIQHVGTRGTDSKTAEEQQINNVHVFVFNADGKYLAVNTAGGTSDAFQGYRYVSDGQNLVLQSSMFDRVEAAENATIVAVANLPEDAFGTVGSSGHPESIADKAALAAHVYSLQTFTASLPETGLPMIGVAQANLAYNDATTGRIVTVQMQSLMARIDLDFTMDPYQSSDDGQNPSLRIDEVYVGNFPQGCTIDPQLDPEIMGGTASSVTDDTQIDLQDEKTVDATDFTGHTLREGEPQSLTLYMFEHARAAKALEDVFEGQVVGDDGYPENIAEDEKQRYKNYLADDDAAYIRLEGVYTNHNGYKYAVTYTLYPGANAVDDFTIKHNRQYKHNITVTGITVNNMGKEALLDIRVDIDSEDNPYFIEMLREREHDAHFCVTPMDVFIYRPGTVKIEIKEVNSENVPSWIRMEPMRYAKENNVENHWAATYAGEGKRKYFTTNLVQTQYGESVLRNDYNKVYTVEYGNTGNSQYTSGTYEERIYFYIDENVPQNQGDDVLAREARLHITYTENKNPEAEKEPRTHERDIIIRQAGMRKVGYYTDYEQYPRTVYTFYIEEYEEYLEHYDSKDHYDHTYRGLEWGFDGMLTGFYDTGNRYLPYGWNNTMLIMDKFRDELNSGNIDVGDGCKEPDITLNDRPRGATEYCYNKNKRNDEGKVEECHWFHPTVHEMEAIVQTHYGSYEEFKGNFYWTSNPGPGQGSGSGWQSDKATWTGEDANYARATKVLPNGYDTDGNLTYSFVHSEADWPYGKDSQGKWDTWYGGDLFGNTTNPQIGDGGFARRTETFRIRAAYILEVPNRGTSSISNVPSLNNTQYLNY